MKQKSRKYIIQKEIEAHEITKQKLSEVDAKNTELEGYCNTFKDNEEKFSSTIEELKQQEAQLNSTIE